MYDPEDGKVKSYQEIWHDLPASGTAFILESFGDLLEVGDMPEARKTWVAMMGDYQVMVERLGVETYLASAVHREHDGSWKTLARAGGPGDIFDRITSPVDPPETPWKAGDVVIASRREWIVKEYFSIP
jgi:Protein HRI1